MIDNKLAKDNRLWQWGKKIFLNENEYLKSKIWYTRRRLIIQRDGKRCVYCEEGGWFYDLHVHHLKYHADFGKDEPKDLVTVCEKCHSEIHKKNLFTRKRR